MKLYEDDVRISDGSSTEFAVVERDHFAVALAFRNEDLLITRQFRYASRSWIWELPQGSIDRDESPEQAAVREVREETGWIGSRPRVLSGRFYEAAAWATQTFRVVGMVLTQQGAAAPDSIEGVIESRLVDRLSLDQMILAGDFPDPASISAVYLSRLCRFPATGDSE